MLRTVALDPVDGPFTDPGYALAPTDPASKTGKGSPMGCQLGPTIRVRAAGHDKIIERWIHTQNKNCNAIQSYIAPHQLYPSVGSQA